MKLPLLVQILLFPLKILFLLALPFFVLLRGSIFLYAHYDWYPWLALLVGFFAAGIVLFIYLAWVWKKLIGKKKISAGARKVKMWLVGLILLVFGGYGLLYLSGNNAKTRQISKDYGALHPILRLGVTSVTLFDREVLITDLKRTHGDYSKMGMGRVRNSLHFKQSDGYVHAIDMRTIGRNEFRNGVIMLWFRLMGFRTLRHVGTADHLHVSLMIHESPGAL